MDQEKLRSLLENISTGKLTIEQGLDDLRRLPFEEVGDFARVDHHRALRTGYPEVIFGPGKTPEQIVGIFKRVSSHHDQVMATRITPEVYQAIGNQLPEAIYQPLSRILYLDRKPDRKKDPGVLVVTAGTSDIPVAEEAAITADLMGNAVEKVYDAGVAGLHRLLDRLEILQRARVLVVVAGMEGALPSVVAGLVSAPVIAVPTSVGYGASFGGLAALLAMLNSCANGVAVVNIDNGFGAGYMAAMINKQASGNHG